MKVAHPEEGPDLEFHRVGLFRGPAPAQGDPAGRTCAKVESQLSLLEIPRPTRKRIVRESEVAVVPHPRQIRVKNGALLWAAISMRPKALPVALDLEVEEKRGLAPASDSESEAMIF